VDVIRKSPLTLLFLMRDSIGRSCLREVSLMLNPHRFPVDTLLAYCLLVILGVLRSEEVGACHLLNTRQLGF
jgi:hypothetical protein